MVTYSTTMLLDDVMELVFRGETLAKAGNQQLRTRPCGTCSVRTVTGFRFDLLYDQGWAPDERQRLVRPTAEQTRRHPFRRARPNIYYTGMHRPLKGFCVGKVPDAPVKPAELTRFMSASCRTFQKRLSLC